MREFVLFAEKICNNRITCFSWGNDNKRFGAVAGGAWVWGYYFVIFVVGSGIAVIHQIIERVVVESNQTQISSIMLMPHPFRITPLVFHLSLI